MGYQVSIFLFVHKNYMLIYNIAPDKVLFSIQKYWYLSYYSTKTYVVGIH